MDIYQKFGVDKDISTSDFMQLLEDKKQLVLRKLNNVFDNPEKEAELRSELDEIEATELIIKSGYKKDSLSTGLYQDEEKEKESRNLEGIENDAEKMFTIAVDYDEKGNYEKALDYFQKAANLDHSNAQFHLGYYYASGEGGIRKDIDKAIFWYEKSARQGSNAAMNNLGVIYDNRNDKKCVEWYEKAIQAGNSKALKNLVEYYERIPPRNSKGKKNYLTMYKWLKLYISQISDDYEKSKTQSKLNKIFIELEEYKNEMPNLMYIEDKYFEFYGNKIEFSYLKYRDSSTELCKQLNEMLEFSDSSDENRIKNLMNGIKYKYDEMKNKTINLSRRKRKQDIVGLIFPILTSIIYFICATIFYDDYDVIGYFFLFAFIVEIIAFLIITYTKRPHPLFSIGFAILYMVALLISSAIVGEIIRAGNDKILTSIAICIGSIIAHIIIFIGNKRLEKS